MVTINNEVAVLQSDQYIIIIIQRFHHIIGIETDVVFYFLLSRGGYPSTRASMQLGSLFETVQCRAVLPSLSTAVESQSTAVLCVKV